MIRVLLADDNKLVRTAVSRLLQADPDIELVGIVGRTDEIPSAVVDLSPDLVLLDVAMCRTRGVQTIQRLRTEGYHGRILMLAARSELDQVTAALETGASGFLLKDDDPDAFKRALPLAALCAMGGRTSDG